MKKQELIHLHALLAEVGKHCEKENVGLDLSRYHDNDTYPMSINHAKDDHRDAVLALATGIGTSVVTDRDEKVQMRAD